MTYDEIVQALRSSGSAAGVAAANMIENLTQENTALRYAARSSKRTENVPYLRALVGELRKEVAELREKAPQWINVADRLPEVWKNEEDDVLVNYMIYSPDFGVDVGNYHAEAKRWLCMALPCSVTHWMPLPNGPKEAGPCG